MSMMIRKVKLSAVQPEGDKNGFEQPKVLEALTKGFERHVKHMAVVEFTVVEQAHSEDGVLTNRVGFTRIEVVTGPSFEQASKLLAESFAARTPDQLPGMSDADAEDMGGRGNE